MLIQKCSLFIFSCTTDIDCSAGMICDGQKSYCRLKSGNSDGTFCTGRVCTEGEGGCRSESECDGSLQCGTNNCAVGESGMRCCTRQCHNHSDCISGECDTDHGQCRLNSDTVNWSKCNKDFPCNEGEGDCDHHVDCEGGLLCGVDNCASGPTYLDCCTGR